MWISWAEIISNDLLTMLSLGWPKKKVFRSSYTSVRVETGSILFWKKLRLSPILKQLKNVLKTNGVTISNNCFMNGVKECNNQTLPVQVISSIRKK